MLKLVAIIAAATSFGSISATSAEVKRGRCHMGDCSWSQEIVRDLIGSNNIGALFRVELRGGDSEHPNNNYNSRARIVWNKQTHNTYVFCSKIMPSVMMQEGPKVFANFLKISVGGVIPGAEESAYGMYLNVCHSIDVDKVGIDPSRLAKTFGYKIDEERFNKTEEKLVQPQDILRF